MSLAYVFEGAKGDCTNCPCDCKNYDNCPLIELDSTEEEVRADERKKFAEWLYKKRYILTNDNATVAWYLCDNLDDILSEYLKEQKGGAEE